MLADQQRSKAAAVDKQVPWQRRPGFGEQPRNAAGSVRDNLLDLIEHVGDTQLLDAMLL
jgi:hypothetical protein